MSEVDGDKRTTPDINELKRIDPSIGRVGKSWEYDLELSAFAQRLGHGLTQLPSLLRALTHSSVPGVREHNDRLAALGAVVLSHYVLEFLYHTYPNMNGVSLQDVVRFFTGEDKLSSLAKHLGISELLLHQLNPDFSKSITTINSESFNAVLGALHVDLGPMAARRLIHDLVIPQLKGLDLGEVIKFEHPKFMLSTVLESQGRPRPVTRLLRESGRATHFPSFVIGVFSGGTLLAEGCGSSLKRAETEALSAALRLHFLKEVRCAPLPSDHEDFMPDSAIELAEELNPDLKKSEDE